MSEVTPIKKSRVTRSITVTDQTAPLLLELVTKAAVTGPQARLLADLYEQVETVAGDLANEA